MNPQKLVWFVPLLPLFGFAFNVFIGTAILRAARKRGEGAEKLVRLLVGLVACGTVGASAVISWILFLHVRETHVALEALLGFDWISVGSGHLQVVAQHKLVVDRLTAVMILVVTNVGFLIHVYSTGYMAGEPRYARYFAYLNLFTGFMLILVMAGNLLLMFVGWEGVGLCSYLLISFWYEKLDNAKAGMKAFITNRVGDFAFMIGVMLLFVYIGSITGTWTVDFGELKHAIGQAHKANMIDGGVMTAVGILLFIGATGKSAQIPLYTWLPDAMAGPTPVSALIHAATMVTAGVYMVARMNFVYAMAPWAMGVVALVGAATALFAGTIAVTQNDIKKVLAYSTVSQLGFMFMGVGVGAWAAGIFHLMTHAFFKACLFLGSGSVIHGMHHEQDIRKMGGLWHKIPLVGACFLVGTLSMGGPLAGMFSKEAIMAKVYEHDRLVWLMLVATAFLTPFYV
ncbi:MAG: NADH-quinone oxidoreductase subunit L, partial [Planctomycetes bacterium]|nr:NADH-quinone oxidoreductase subunit L [Planctomycetota bacterium]